MFTKTMIALVTAVALSASFGSFANAKNNDRDCSISTLSEEGYRSAEPSWRVC
jgi:hypothetical protein